MQAPPEKLGAFYLGAEYDLAASARIDTPIHYDARDLLTHGVVVGMTGSGKTGLCIGLLEEAALDKIPVIMIDPKGDMANLLLQFPEQRPEDFAPWIDPGEAARKGISVEEMAVATAQQWSNGLADWGITGDRIRALQEAVEYTIFTPGSDAGIPVSIVGSFKAPTLDWATEAEAIRERITGTVGALFSMMGNSADPVRSREGVLLGSIIEHYWQQKQDISMEMLIKAIQSPPMAQIGVFEVDTFFPPKERFGMALEINTLIASPSFKSWLEGAPMDVQSFLYTPEGKPRHSIFYIAHLSDSERMFFVTLLLENILTWVRAQSGTTSLRAILYFDEVFGYLPPVAAPASKRPLMTLLKQARAFGFGVLLATQNPADLDYKALTNTGTWLIGKLQAERDKARLIEGLQGLSEGGPTEPLDYDKLIPQLGSRVFLLHNVHSDGPVVMTTRWVHSYLRGPLTKPQVKLLMDPQRVAFAASDATTAAGAAKPSVVPSSVAAPAAAATASSAAPAGYSNSAPSLGDKVQQVFLPAERDLNAAVKVIAQEIGAVITPATVTLTYTPAALAAGSVSFVATKLGVDESHDFQRLAFVSDGLGGSPWDEGEPLSLSLRDLRKEPETISGIDGVYYAPIPDAARSATALKKLQSDLNEWLYRNERLDVRVHPALGLAQKSGESEGEYKARLQHAAREQRDAEVDKLRASYGKKIESLEQKLAKEKADLAQEKANANSYRTESLVSWAEAAMSMLGGRRRSVSSQLSKQRRAGDAAARAEATEEILKQLAADKAELEAELTAQIAEITQRWDGAINGVTVDNIAPRRSDVKVDLIALAWAPYWNVEYSDGAMVRSRAVPAWK
jgi:hypothetical protein